MRLRTLGMVSFICVAILGLLWRGLGESDRALAQEEVVARFAHVKTKVYPPAQRFAEDIARLLPALQAATTPRAEAEARLALARRYAEYAQELRGPKAAWPGVVQQYLQPIFDRRPRPEDAEVWATARLLGGDYHASRRDFVAAQREYQAARTNFPQTTAAFRARARGARWDLDRRNPGRNEGRGRQQLRELAANTQAPVQARLEAWEALIRAALLDQQVEEAVQLAEQAQREQGGVTEPGAADALAAVRELQALACGRQKRYAEAIDALTELIQNYHGENKPTQFGGATSVQLARYRRACLLRAAGRVSQAQAEFAALANEMPEALLGIRARGQLEKLSSGRTAQREDGQAEQRRYAADLERYGCGVIALRTLCRLAGRSVTTEEIAALVQPAEDASSSLADLAETTRNLGLPTVGVATDLRGLVAVAKPVLAWVGRGHYVLVTGVQEGQVGVLDPTCGKGEVPLSEFAAAWQAADPEEANRIRAAGGVGDQPGYLLALAPAGQRLLETRMAQALTPAEMGTIRGAWGFHVCGWMSFFKFHKPPQIPGGAAEFDGVAPDLRTYPAVFANLSFAGLIIHGHEDFRVPVRGVRPLIFVRSLTWQNEFGLLWLGSEPWFHSQEGYIHTIDPDFIEKREGYHSMLQYLDNGDGTYTPSGGGHEEMVSITGGYRMTKPDGTVYTFDLYDSTNYKYFLTQVEDRYGNTTTYSYTNYKLQTVTGPGGEQISFQYNGNNDISSVTDPAGRTYTYEYDGTQLVRVYLPVRTPNGLRKVGACYEFTDGGCSHGPALVGVVDPEGNRTGLRFGPTLDNNTVRVIREIIDAQGNSTFYTIFYDWPAPNGKNYVAVTDAKGRQKFYMFYDWTCIATIDDQGNTEVFDWDADYNLIRIADRNGSETRLCWDAEGQLTSVTQVLAGGGETVYDALGNPVGADPTSEVTQTTLYSYNEYGPVSSVRDPLGRITVNIYDERGNVVEEINPRNEITRHTYNSYGQRIRTVDARGNTWTCEYDVHGNLVKTTDPEGHSTTAEFDPAGNKIQEVDALDRTTLYEYDELNRLIKVTFPDNNYETYEYDRNGLLTKKTDAEGKVTTYTYTPLFQLASVTDDDNHTTSYEYDEVGNKTKMTDAKSRETTYEYDELDRLIKVTYPDSKYEEFTYDATGNLVTKKGRDGKVTTMTYDALKRLTEVVGPGE